MASRDRVLAAAIVRAIGITGKPPVLYALAGSELDKAGRANPDLRVVSEVFADRTYQPDGSLTPRSRADALITDEATAVVQVLRMVREGKVTATDGRDVMIRADTICLHGDGAHAVGFAQAVHAALRAAGVTIRA